MKEGLYWALKRVAAMQHEEWQSAFGKLLELVASNTYQAWREKEWQSLSEWLNRIASLVEHDCLDEEPHQRLIEESLSKMAPEIQQWGSLTTALEYWQTSQEA